MGLLSSSSSLTRYRVEGKLEKPVMETVYAGLIRNAIANIDDNAAEKAMGWTSFNDPFVPSFEGSSFTIGSYFLKLLPVFFAH